MGLPPAGAPPPSLARGGPAPVASSEDPSTLAFQSEPWNSALLVPQTPPHSSTWSLSLRGSRLQTEKGTAGRLPRGVRSLLGVHEQGGSRRGSATPGPQQVS